MVMMMIKFSSYASRMRAEDAAERKLGWLKKRLKTSLTLSQAPAPIAKPPLLISPSKP